MTKARRISSWNASASAAESGWGPGASITTGVELWSSYCTAGSGSSPVAASIGSVG